MADTKISQLTEATELQSTDSFVIARGASNYKISAETLGIPRTATLELSSQDIYDSTDNPIELFPELPVGYMWVVQNAIFSLPPQTAATTGSATYSYIELVRTNTPFGMYISGSTTLRSDDLDVVDDSFSIYFYDPEHLASGSVVITISEDTTLTYTPEEFSILNKAICVSLNGPLDEVSAVSLIYTGSNNIYGEGELLCYAKFEGNSRVSTFTVTVNVIDGEIDSIISYGGVMWPEHLNEDFTLYDAYDNPFDALVRPTAVEPYITGSLSEPVIVSAVAVPLRYL
jgi:hypothetical protein